MVEENGSPTTDKVIDALVPPEVMRNPPVIEVEDVPIAPSMERTQKYEYSEEVKCEEDISMNGGVTSTKSKSELDDIQECEIDRKDCGVLSMSVLVNAQMYPARNGNIARRK